MLREVPDVSDAPDVVTLAPQDDSMGGSVEFKNVYFHYGRGDGVDGSGLRNISFKLQPGKTLAFVGETGSSIHVTSSTVQTVSDYQWSQVFELALSDDVLVRSCNSLCTFQALERQASFEYYFACMTRIVGQYLLTAMTSDPSRRSLCGSRLESSLRSLRYSTSRFGTTLRMEVSKSILMLKYTRWQVLRPWTSFCDGSLKGWTLLSENAAVRFCISLSTVA